MNKYSVFLLGYSIVFSLLCGFGFFGYGIDFYEGYSVGSYKFGVIYDRIGFALSVIQFGGFWLAAFISSMLQFMVYSRVLFLRFGLNNPIYKLLIIILLSFSWNHLLSSLNMVRQSIAINIFYLVALSYNIKFNSIYFLLGPFLHKISPILWIANQIKNVNFKSKKFVNLSIFLSILLFIPLYIKLINGFSVPTVGFDLKYLIILITTANLFLLVIKRNLIPNNVFFASLIISAIIFGFIFSGANHIAERVFLSYLGFLLISLVYFFKNNSNFRFSMLLLLSFYVIISWTLGPLQNALF